MEKLPRMQDVLHFNCHTQIRQIYFYFSKIVLQNSPIVYAIQNFELSKILEGIYIFILLKM